MYQEETYEASDYIQPQHARCKTDQVDEECRVKMSEWCFQVLDFCNFNRETVEISMNYLDRYLSTELGREALSNRTKFQLVAMTCLYTAVKLHEPEAMTPDVMSRLSRGSYAAQEFEQCELQLLRVLNWRMNPPTASAFVRHFMDLVPSALLDDEDKAMLMEFVSFQVELSVNDYSCVTMNASTIAYCAIANALTTIGCMGEDTILDGLSRVAGIERYSARSVKAQEILFACMQSSETSSAVGRVTPHQSVTKTSGRSTSVHSSPRCVASQ